MQKISVDYSHIELTAEEIERALNKAKADKHYSLEMEAYRRKIWEKPVYPTLSFNELKKLVLSRNTDFKIDEQNEVIFDTLCQYFSNDPSFELDGEYSFKKGILLFGPVGCGKTTLMRMFSVNSFRPFELTPCRDIANLYTKNGADAINAFANLQPTYPQQNFGHDSMGRCFDDLGTEEIKKNFGNSSNVMQDVLYSIYDNRLTGKFHITTNLSGDDIEEIYGTRIRSRMREMFNTIGFDKLSLDRRK